jgi:hypothetical protein
LATGIVNVLLQLKPEATICCMFISYLCAQGANGSKL